MGTVIMAYSIDQTFSSDLDPIKNLKSSQLSGVSNTITSTDWNDDIYLVNYGMDAQKYLNARGDSEAVSSTLCLVFLANYLGLKESSADDLTALYKSIWPLMTIGNQHVFTKLGTGHITTQALGAIDISKYKFPCAAMTMTMKSSKMTKEHVKKFWDEILRMAEAGMPDRSKLINLTAFIMINCLRLIKKESTCQDYHMM